MRRPLVLLGFVAAVIALVVPTVAQAATGPTKLDAFIYVDTVNGTRPAGAKPRPIGCTQSNVFTRGEQMVFRVWGTDAATGDILSTEPGNMVGPTSQGMDDLIALDPDAYWDNSTQSVQNSEFGVSPRIVLIPLHDPRYKIERGRTELRVTKVAAFFMERMQGKEVVGRFIKVRGPGDPCPAGVGAGSFVSNLSLIQ